MKKIKDFVDEVNALDKGIKELEDTLRILRDVNNKEGWEYFIHKDERVPVKLLYAELQKQRKELAEVLDINVTAYSHPFKTEEEI